MWGKRKAADKGQHWEPKRRGLVSGRGPVPSSPPPPVSSVLPQSVAQAEAPEPASVDETEYLLSSPENAERLLAAIARLESRSVSDEEVSPAQEPRSMLP